MNEQQLRKRLKYLLKTYYQDVLVSEFVMAEFASDLSFIHTIKVYVVEEKFIYRTTKQIKSF